MTTPKEVYPLIAHALTAYLAARTAQRRDYTNETLNWARTETHNELLWQLHVAGIECDWREDAVRAAEETTQ